MIVDTALREFEATNRPIRVGMPETAQPPISRNSEVIAPSL